MTWNVRRLRLWKRGFESRDGMMAAGKGSTYLSFLSVSDLLCVLLYCIKMLKYLPLLSDWIHKHRYIVLDEVMHWKKQMAYVRRRTAVAKRYKIWKPKDHSILQAALCKCHVTPRSFPMFGYQTP
jgi:hypothetical protein